MPNEKRRGLLIVFSGPSGCGKGTVLSELLAMRDDTVLSVSVTTRAPRPGDVDGVQYFFRSREQVEEMIRNDELLEYAEYNGNYYGTPRAAVEEMLNDGKNVVLEIEVQGAEKVMNRIPEHTSVFLSVPSMEELERRLRSRGTETEESVRNRLAAASAELQRAPYYQYQIVNDDVQTAVERFNAVIEAEKQKR